MLEVLADQRNVLQNELNIVTPTSMNNLCRNNLCWNAINLKLKEYDRSSSYIIGMRQSTVAHVQKKKNRIFDDSDLKDKSYSGYSDYVANPKRF